MRLRALVTTAALGLVTAAGGLAAAAPAQAADTSMVSVLHAIPDTPVDVYANGDKLLSDFEPGTLAGPLELPADTYEIQITPAGAARSKAVIEDSVDVPAGVNATLVAHLSAKGTPTLTTYVNDTSKVAAGDARLTVRHDAAAPAVDVRAGGKVVVPGLTNPKEASLEVPAGTVQADVVLAGTDTVAIGPADLDLAEGTSTIVYAWGSAQDDNLALAVQTIKGMHGSPNGVPGGEAGLVADNGTPWGLTGIAVAALAVAGVVAAGLVRRRPAAQR